MVKLTGKQKEKHVNCREEQQRVCLARAIVNKPSLIIADEPTGNLDPETSREIVQLLEEIILWSNGNYGYT